MSAQKPIPKLKIQGNLPSVYIPEWSSEKGFNLDSSLIKHLPVI